MGPATTPLITRRVLDMIAGHSSAADRIGASTDGPRSGVSSVIALLLLGEQASEQRPR
jgi:hypothetical protein